MANSSPNTIGIDLFKSEVTKVLQASKDLRIEKSKFRLKYSEIFGKTFNHEKYGFPKKTLATYLDDINDTVTCTTENWKYVITLKEKANGVRDETTSSQASSSKSDPSHGQRLNDNKTGKSKVQTVHTSKNPSRRRRGIEGFSFSDSEFPSINAKKERKQECQALPTHSLKSTSHDVGDPKEKQLTNHEIVIPAHSDSLSSYGSQTGIEHFKTKVKAILQDKPNRKIEMGQFVPLYERKFKTAFNHKAYGFSGKKVSTLLKKIPDVVELEENGSSLYVKLKDLSDHSGPKYDQVKTCSFNSQPVIPNSSTQPVFGAIKTGSAKSVPSSKPKDILSKSRLQSNPYKGTRVPQVTPRPSTQATSRLQGQNNQTLGDPFILDHRHTSISTSSLGLQNLLGNVEDFPTLTSKSPSSSSTTSEVYTQEDFPSLPPANSTKSRRSKRHCIDNDDDKQSCSGTPGPFEESFNRAQNTQLLNSQRKKAASRKMSPPEINELVKQVREGISTDNDHVSLEILKVMLCKKLGVISLRELGYRRPDTEIPELKELSRLLCKLDLYGRAYVMVHGISTLTELGQGMANLFEKKDFLDLQVGPLVKLPVVYDLFKAPSDDVIIQQVTTVHILKHLNQYLTKNNKWTNKVDLKDFMKYLCEIYKCDTPYELGVRIQSIGLGISVLKRAQKFQSEKSKEVEQELASDMGREIEKRCKKIKDDLFGSSRGDERSLLHKLLGSSVIDIITRVFDHCQELFEQQPRAQLHKVNHFLNMVTIDKSFRDLFNLAIHMACKDIVCDVLEDYKTELIEEVKENSRANETTSEPPSKKTLIKEAQDWLKAAEHLDLSTLARIEKNLANLFPGFDVFSAFGYGTWLEFLTNEKELYKLLESRGASICGESKNSKVKVNLDSVYNFIIQCGPKATEELVQHALCVQYHIPSVTDLGVKSCKTLMEQSTQRKHVQQPVIYELALLCKDGDTNVLKNTHSQSKKEAKPRAGLLGWKSSDDAVKALASVPLLADMKEWTQWNAVFQPCLGDLKQFIEQESLKKRDDGIQVQALETKHGNLLKVNTTVSLKDFEKSVDEKDVIGTAGNLVSLVIRYGGIQAAPLALMITHIRSMLLTLASADQEDEGQMCPRFVLKCLCRIPHRMCVALATRVFLEPLSAAVGTGLANQLLLSCCDNYKQQCCLHQLGLSLGHTEWIEDFKSMITGETEIKQVLEEKRKKLFQDLRPVAVIKPVTFEPVKQEEEMQEPKVQEDSEEPLLPAAEDEILTEEGTGTSECQTSNDEEELEEFITEENPCKTLIESIRKEEFGIGVNLGEEESKLVQKQREREGRSLHRLAAELYSRDTHFVLELIQNADDNTFTTEEPTIVFMIEPHGIMVLNNEVGFKEENIRALCDVGKSTKGAHQYGYIGQKGIGFKSVFRVSNRPEVHSNGYHICFDANSGPSGYILPHWIDGDSVQSSYGSNLSSDIDGLQLESWMTRIVLPLKEEFHGDKKNSLSARFNDVHPSLLLFLHRLRRIILVNKTKIQQMTRQDLDGGVIQISDSQGTNRWLVVKKKLKVIEAREDIDMTELALAFPMPKEEKTTSREVHTTKTLPAQNVFAYLPLRSYGFKFIIQGDFEVPSSREDVDGDKAWNQWLREEIPKLFIDALDVFKNHPNFPGLSGVAKFLQFVPLKEEILDFFTPVAEIILKYLQGMDCLPVEKVVKDKAENGTEEGHKSQYDWIQPCKVVACKDPEIMALVSAELLHRHLALHYLVPDLVSAINPALRQELGIRTLSVKHLIEVGKSVMKEDSSEMRDNTKRVKWIAQWLHCVYRCLEREHNSSSDILDQISAMTIFPLSDYTFVNLKDHAIFFPLSVNQQTMKAKKKRSTAKYLQELENDLLVLSPELLNHLGSVGHSQVEKLLQQLGVKSWTAKDVIHNHILPTLKCDEWKVKKEAVLQSYLIYIFNERLSDPRVCDLDELKDCAQVLTNKGPRNPCETPVHFTQKYGNTLNLSDAIPNISWTLIDDSYLNEMSSSTGRPDLEKFFSALGVQHFLIITRRLVTLNKMTLDTSPWASHYDLWPKTSDSAYVVEDYCCDELDEFMSKSIDPRQATTLAESLDKQWKDHYSKYADKIPLKDSEGRDLQSHTLSSFLLNLKTRPWLPVLRSNTCSVPSELYIFTEEVCGVLDEHVHYVGVNLQDATFAKVLGVTMSVTLDNLLDDHLIKWSKHSLQSSVAGQNQGFDTSLAHMKRVYEYIYEKFKASRNDETKISNAFQKHPLIFVHRNSYSTKETPDQKTVGEFHQKKEVCWNDPSNVTHELLKTRRYTAKRQILSVCYKEFHEFFRSCLTVDLTPHSDEYIEMASVLVSENPVPTPSVLTLIIEIFAVLGQKCLTRPLKESDYAYVDSARYAHTEVSLEDEEINPANAKYLKAKLANEDIFPCANGWVSLSEKPILPDSKRLKKVFENEKDVHFISLEQTSQKSGRQAIKRPVQGQKKKMEFVQVFLRSCDIPKLSDCVEETLTPNKVAYQCLEVQQYFHLIAPCVQRYIYHHMPERYQNLLDDQYPEMLAEMTFATVDSLEVVYRLKNLPQITVKQQAKWGHENEQNKIFFYAVRSQIEIAKPLNHEIAKLFGAGVGDVDKKFENFLELLRMNLGMDVESFLLDQEVESLPEEEKSWYVPAPEIPKTPEIVEEESFEPVFTIENAPYRDYENDGALTCWPPRAPVSKNSSYPYEQRPTEKATEVWPVPEAPSSIKYQVKTDEPLPMQKNVPPAEQYHENNNAQITSGTSSKRDDGLENRGLSSSQNKAWDQQVPDGDETHPQEDLARVNTTASITGNLETSKQHSQVGTSLQNTTINPDSSSAPIFSPDMQISVQDLEFENLPAVSLPEGLAMKDNPNKDEIGYWGEKFVYDYLNFVLRNSADEVKWMNEQDNYATPYDIEVRQHANDAVQKTYIEVKSTSGGDKEHFEISAAELRFALEQREKLHLYRVFNVGNPNAVVFIQRAKNLAAHLEKKSVRLFMVI